LYISVLQHGRPAIFSFNWNFFGADVKIKRERHFPVGGTWETPFHGLFLCFFPVALPCAVAQRGLEKGRAQGESKVGRPWVWLSGYLI
jgi:hypothetical protein